MERYDLNDTITVLTRAEYVLRAFALVGNEDTRKLHKEVKEEAARLRKLYTETPPGLREQFIADHPCQYYAMDGLYDCGNPQCPKVGFKSKEDKEHHYKMWGIELRS